MARKTPEASKALISLPENPTAEQTAVWLNEVLTAKTLDSATRAKVLRLFEATPELWRATGNIGKFARQTLIDLVTGEQAVFKLALEHEATKLERDLGYATAPPLEKLLIEQVICCWINANDVQRRYSNALAQNITLTLGIYWEKRLSAAQRRYLRAIETLARVRRLATPHPLQVNIGGRQINMVGGPPTPLPLAGEDAAEVGTTGVRPVLVDAAPAMC